jgi:CBS domain-containing protein
LEAGAGSVLARDLMTRPVLTIREDRTVQELVGFLAENTITGAPVLDGSGKLVGVVALTDIAERAVVPAPGAPRQVGSGYFREGWEERISPDELRELTVTDTGLLVRDIMTPVVYTVPDDTPVEKLARTMIAGRIHRLLVTSGGHVSGIVTTLDLLKLLTGKRPVLAAAHGSAGRYPSVDTDRLSKRRAKNGTRKKGTRGSKRG